MTAITDSPGVVRQQLQDDMLRAQVEQEKLRVKVLNAQVFLVTCLALMIPVAGLCAGIWFVAAIVFG